MGEHKQSRKDATREGQSTGNKSRGRNDTGTLEAKLKKVTLGDGHKQATHKGRALPRPDAPKAAPKR